MGKQIIIVGGGISGLSLLFYLRQKYGPDSGVSVSLFEKETRLGGNIHTVRGPNLPQFELGPNGFLDGNPGTLDLARALGIEKDLIKASSSAKTRYICIGNTLHGLSKNPLSLFKFKPLSLLQKLRIFKEYVIPKGDNEDETVYDFSTRRLGEAFSKFFFDPIASGIFGGDIKKLNMKYAFPRAYQLEQTHGSILKGVFKSKKSPEHLCSFKSGMGQLTTALENNFSEIIKRQSPVTKISREGSGYNVRANGTDFSATELILCVPAYAAAEILTEIDPDLCAKLKTIPYSSITVVGLAYSIDQVKNIPQGFGYLRPSFEGSETLGVLFTSQIFPERCPDGKVIFQVMLGGSHHPETVTKTDEEILKLARQELENVLGVKGDPSDRYLQRWPHAIPQYDRSYPQAYRSIKESLKRHPHLHLLSNYLDGISVNDCAANAKKLAEMLYEKPL